MRDAMTGDHPTKMMHPSCEAPPGLETDGKGNAIPFAERTADNQEKAQNALRDRMHSAGSVKDPENEAAAPGAMPPSQQGQGPEHKPIHDLEGQQGGTHGGGHEAV